MMNIVSCLVFGIYILRACEGHGSGAPSESCVTMATGHHYDHNDSRPISPQEKDSPFRVSLNKNEYGKGGMLEVTVTGTNSFQGFLLQARLAGEEEPVGAFSGFGAMMKTVSDCSSTYPEGTLTHSNKDPWDDSFTVTWTAPDEDVGNITFYVTVAQDHDIFWEKLPSDTITYSGFAILQSTTIMLLLPITLVMSELM